MANLLDNSVPRKPIWVTPPDQAKDGWGIEWVVSGELSSRADEDELAKLTATAAAQQMAAELRQDGHVSTGLLTSHLESDNAIDVSAGTATIRPPQEREDFIERESDMGINYMAFEGTVAEATQKALDDYAKQAIKSG